MSMSGEQGSRDGTTTGAGDASAAAGSSTDPAGAATTSADPAGAGSSTKTGTGATNGTDTKTAEDRDRAEKLQVAGAAAAGGAASDLSRSTGDLAKSAGSRAADLREERRMVLKMKMDLEKERRAANAEAVYLVSKIAASENQSVIATSTLAALQTATAALADIVVSLDEATLFWGKIEQSCTRLSNNSSLQNQIKRASRETDKALRIAKYDSSYIKGDAVQYLASWRALQLLCGSYKTAVQATYKEAGNRIRQSPNIDESRAMLPALKARVMDSLKKEQAESLDREMILSKSLSETDASIPEVK